MPALGLGVFQSSAEETATAVSTALQQGYRLIDTASGYFNERQVGEGIRTSGVARDDIFLTTKLWMGDYGYDRAIHAFETSLTKLGQDYVDLYLLHWPVPGNFDDTVAAYKAAEEMLADGRARAIGVCNFKPEHLTALLDRVDVVPAVNQVELHPFFQQADVAAANRSHNIVTQAWSPIGGIFSYDENAAADLNPLTNSTLAAVADAHGKTAAQVMLRWHLQEGRSAIPKSVKPQRIAENFDVFDFELTASELASVAALDRGARGGPDPDQINPDVFSLEIDVA
ncbi:aldo/keto reductase [Clavibacter zhangzhiyongii]|uniref:aldo/keto reductase n=1 Tax=Clavibacter zhangzhiyongii TaxID=2768071 RepID=UPI0039E0201A